MTDAHANAIAKIAVASVKLAEEAKSRLAAAPKSTDPALVEKAAAALVATGFVEAGSKQAAVDKLSTPTGAVELVHDLAVKAGEEIARVSGTGNPRLAAGELTPVDGTKQAGAPSSAADAEFVTRMNAYRTNAPK